MELRDPAWEAARQQPIWLLRKHAVHYGPVTVGRGTVTDVFVDALRITLLGQRLSLIESLLRPLLRIDQVELSAARQWSRSRS